MSSFGFDVENVFGGGGIGNGRFRKKGKKKMDDMEDMLMGSLGEDFGFGERILRPAGRANGRGEGFLDIIGMQQFGIPQIAGREPTVAGARRAKRAKVARVTGRRQPRQPRQPQTFGAIAGLEGLGTGIDVLQARTRRTALRDIQPIRRGIQKFKAKREAKQTRKRVAEFTREREEEEQPSRQPPALPDFSQGGFV